MGAEDVHLLCTGDLHLGRYPTKIPERYQNKEFSPGFIWEDIVKKAVDKEVDAVVIAGDVIDKANCYYETYGPFEEGVKELGESGISVFAVAGNHDYGVLPKLARNISTDYFNFLGGGGKWEIATLNKGGKEVLNFVGWSYPKQQVKENPLKSFKAPDNGVPTIGLLHAEVDNSGGKYAPVSSARLQGLGVTGWVLGHIHKPELVSDLPGFILYPGSPQPLNPTDRSNHGIWEIVIDSNSGVEISKKVLASLRYVEVDVKVDNLEEEWDLPGLISEKLEAKLAKITEEWIPKLVISRINLTGRTNLHPKIEEEKDRLGRELNLQAAGCPVVVEKITNQTKLPLNLEDLAGGNSPVGLLAEYLIKLEKGQAEELPEELEKQVEKKLLSAYRANAYQPLQRENRIKRPKKEEVREILREQARILLANLVEQKEENR